jgi:hypothetical protein
MRKLEPRPVVGSTFPGNKVMREAGKNTKRINLRRPVLQAAKLRYISLASLGLICLLLFLLQLATSASQSSSREFNGRAPRQAVGETHVSNADLGSSKAMRDASLTPLPSSTTSTQGSGIQIPTRLPISSVNLHFEFYKEFSLSYQDRVIKWAHKLSCTNVLNVQLKHWMDCMQCEFC